MTADPYRPETDAPDPDERSTAIERAIAWLRVYVTPERIVLVSLLITLWCAMHSALPVHPALGWIFVSAGPTASGIGWLARVIGDDEEWTDNRAGRAAFVCANAAAMAIALTVLT